MQTIETESGIYVILSMPGGKLADDAEICFAEATCCGSDIIYADHTVRFPDGKMKEIRKPNWSPDTLLSVNYVEGPIAVKNALLRDCDNTAFRTPEERYALLLAITERTSKIAHIHKSLCICDAEKPLESIVPLTRAVRRRKLKADVMRGLLPGSFALRYAVPTRTRVSCIVYGNGSAAEFRTTLESIATQCCWPNIELVIADCGGVATEKERYFAALKQNRAAKIVRLFDGSGLARTINAATNASTGEVLLFLPSGIRLSAYETLEHMLEFALLPHVGAVGGIQTEFGRGEVRGIIHNALSLPDGPLMTRRDCYYASGGFDETLEDEGFLHAYTFFQTDRHLYNVVTPYARFIHPQAGKKPHLSETNQQRLCDIRWMEANDRQEQADGRKC